MVLGNKSEYWGNSYGYDAWGNLLQKTITKCGAENLSVTADAHNWIHASGTDYQYDAAGNMTYDATASLSYNFDQENRLTGAAGYTYTYDGDGNRVRKSTGSTGTLYWYMAPGIVGESDLSGNLTDEYVFFNGERVARKSTNGVFYYFSDHLKTASVVTDSLGNIKSESDFYPWGGEIQFVNNDSNHYKFTGKERDSETQLDYFGARHYSNGLGRWISADWSSTPVPVPYADLGDPQSLNLYGYVRNIPTSRADVDGHEGPGSYDQMVELTHSIEATNAATASFFKRVFTVENVKNALNSIADDFNHFMHQAQQPMPGCGCSPPPSSQLPEEENKKNNNNSQSSNQNANSGGQKASSSGTGRAPSKIDRGAFNAERKAFWKAEAKANPGKYSAENLARMEKGKPPIGPDGHPMELHHVDRTQNGPLEPKTRTDHRLGENYKKNHPE